MENKKKFLLIGWDAADWKIIHPLMDAGMMPALESLVNNGVMGNIATLDPPLSPMLWTSISTGKHADQHGILGFTEPAPEGQGVRPCMITSRKVKAIWNMLSQSGYKTNVVGWWPSHPAEPINGVSISNFFQNANSEYGTEWYLAPGAVHPKEKEELYKQFRIHPAELTEAHILPFVPDAAKVDQEKDKRLGSINKITAECSSIHAATTYILENEEWDFTAVYYDAIDHYCHGFMNFHPPKIPYIPKEMFDMYKGVVQGGYIYHDMMLSRLLEFVDEDTTVMIISDHGFHSDHLRPDSLPEEPAGPAWEHRDYGIIVIKGPGIQKDERIFGATLLDVAPTILTILGLPIGRDMEGKPLLQAFENSPTPQYIDSWEVVEGECGMHPKDIQRDPIAEQAAMQQLIELGYIDKPDENIDKQIENTVNESKFYLTRVLMNKNKHFDALPILEELYNKDNTVIRYAFQYAKCLDAIGKYHQASEVVEKIITYEENKPEKNPEETKTEDTLAENELENEVKTTEPEESKPKEEVGKKIREYPQLFLLKGTLELAKKNYDEALIYLKKAENSDPRLPQLHQQLANVYLKMRRLNDAEAAINKALEIDPESATAHHIMSNVKMRRRDYEEAANYALNTVGLLYNFPSAHFNLGVALTKLGMFERAIEAFQVCIKILPGFVRPYKYLSYIYLVHLKDNEKVKYYNEQIKALTSKEKNLPQRTQG